MKLFKKKLLLLLFLQYHGDVLMNEILF